MNYQKITTYDLCKKMRDEVSYVANRMYFLVDRIDSDSLRSDFKSYILRLNDLVDNISLVSLNCDKDRKNPSSKTAGKKKRNCDVLSKDEVLKVLNNRSFSKEDTIEWLYEEAKGETK